ncbi:hypothetical protein KKC22_13510 [Myxococcota bacterium]|nr:hypothetical protein [Myxococcota bacterium]
MKTKKSYTPYDKRMIGRRYASSDIQRQIQDIQMLWRMFLSTFTKYGMGPDELAEFETGAADHKSLLSGRPEALAAKSLTLEERNQILHDAWVWVSMVSAALSVIARKDADCATKLNAALPVDDDDLLWSVDTLMTLLTAKAGAFSPAIPVSDHLGAGTALRDRLSTIFGRTTEAKMAPVQDTAEIDELDGHLYIIMRDFNEAGRAAVRAGLIDQPLSTFRFTHIGPAARRTAPAPTPQV